MATNGILASQLNGPYATNYTQAVINEVAKLSANGPSGQTAGLPYLESLSIATADQQGPMDGLLSIGLVIGYPLPTLSVTAANSFKLGDSASYPVSTTSIGLGDGMSSGGFLSDAFNPSMSANVTATQYRAALGIVAKIKRAGGLTVKMIDALAHTFSSNYQIIMPGVSLNQFTLGDSAMYPQASTTIGFADITGSTGGLLADSAGGLSGDIYILIYDKIGAVTAQLIQNIASAFATSPQVNVTYLGT